MKAGFSEYLNSIAPAMKELIALLGSHYDYVSVLSTDSSGFSAMISQRAKSVSNSTMFTERGNVVRVQKNGLYSEYAFNEFDTGKTAELAAKIRSTLDAQLELLSETGSKVYDTAVLPDEPAQVFAEMETGSMPEDTDLQKLLEELSSISDEAMRKCEIAVDCMVRCQSTHVSKMFLTANRDMRQSYVYSEGMVAPVVMKNGKTETVFDLDGLLYLVEEHMGSDARHLLEDFTAPDDDAAEYIDSLEKENQRLRDHHHEVMEDLRAQSETIARLIQKPEIDRSALSTVAGIIGRTTWREINVG